MISADALKALPKAELHIHIEGALEPELMFDLAKKNNVSLPYSDVAAIHEAYDFSQLQDFLDLYYAGTSVLQHEPDFFELADRYFRRVEADGATRVEVFFDPQAHTDRGIAFSTLFEGLDRAANAARGRGLEVDWIMCFLRHLDESAALTTLEGAERYLGRILGVGLDSSEVGHPPTKFTQVFREAEKLGLHKVAHAGEEGPPEYIWQALDELGVERIDHGNRSLEDPALLARLRSEQMPLTVCPLSNLKLCVVNSLESHPLRAMLDAGLNVCLNSDDPAYFGGYLNDNYLQLGNAVGLSKKDIEALAAASLSAAFR